MEKYNLVNYHTVYCDSTITPPKLTWKRIANNAIRQYHMEQWTVHVTWDPEFARFSVVTFTSWSLASGPRRRQLVKQRKPRQLCVS
ncbi:hypothetical protein DPMN_101529 [Dreissena polymorpha]|uniref:Uncharacterized protein n=1 Tax=Dreissena polymorpha TaxID=45954 RepID=A0A9D4RA53_DREPO|nr:hypothetical protein DPMN_101297 [Dreissena polymorpha]KAH3858885.1 hypothetical protein DPMN_101529 [Dreissena polymorpha]